MVRFYVLGCWGYESAWVVVAGVDELAWVVVLGLLPAVLTTNRTNFAGVGGGLG